MPPIDRTPDDGEVLHQPVQPPFPESKPGRERQDETRGQPAADPGRGAPAGPRVDPLTGAGEDVAG